MSMNRHSAFAPHRFRFEEAAVTGALPETYKAPFVEKRPALVRGGQHLHALTIGLDFSPNSVRAARRAAMLARERAARRVSLVHVRPGKREMPEDEVESMRLRAETIARELALPPATHAHVEVRRGSAAAALAGAAERSALVVIGTATNQLAQHVPAMSLAWRLIARLRCPLLVVRERPSAPYRQVAVAIDLSKRDRSALQWAQLIAPEAQIELMHVLEVPFEGKMRYAGVKDRVIEKYRMNALLQAVDSMEQLLAYSPSDNVTSRIFDGRIASRIVDRTREVDADLVVVAPASKTAFERWLLPSVTASVMSESTRDVLVVPEST